MKKLVNGLVVLAAIALLTGCVAGAASQSDSKVTCPACGYQFETPAANP